MPTGRICVSEYGEDEPLISDHATIVLGPDVVSYSAETTEDVWITRPLRDLRWIEWDEPPFDTEPDVLATLRQFVAQLSPDDLEQRIEAAIGQEGLHRQGDWVKAALMGMLS